jgi:hypothetical protein
MGQRNSFDASVSRGAVSDASPAPQALALLPSCNTGVKSFGELYNRGLDWFTSTSCDPDIAGRLRLIALAFAKELETSGEKLKVHKWQGYDGFKSGPFFYGERHDGACSWGSGVAAEPLFVATKGLALHPTRLDLQTTLVLPWDTTGYARLFAQAVKAASGPGGDAAGRGRGRPTSVQLIESFGDGDTVYVGSPTSEVRGRSYDKHKESGGKFPVGSWRYEVQYKGSQAGEVYSRLRATDDVGKAVVSHVARWYGDKGVPMPLEHIEAVEAVKTAPHEADVERSLRWLHDTVRPAVQDLCDRGYFLRVLVALGLQDCGIEEPTALEKLLRQRGVIR